MLNLLKSTGDGFSDIFEIVRRHQALIYTGTVLGLMIAVIVTR